jgi:transcription antitermination factor NusG
MPVLPLEPFVFPEHLLEDAGQVLAVPGNWWVLHTKPRAEKAVARKLHRKDIAFFLPLFERRRRSTNRSASVHMPLFPGYLFLRGDGDARLAALETDLIANCLPVLDAAALQADLARVYRLMQSEAPLHPENYVLPGTLVEIVDGPLAGLKGKVIRRGRQLRFFVEVRMLRCGVSVELDRWMFQPVS